MTFKEWEQEMNQAMYDKFYLIIEKWLKVREIDYSWYQESEENKLLPKYIMEMLKEINNEMPEPMLDKLKQAEISACGHIDYHHKFALHCAKLYKKGVKDE